MKAGANTKQRTRRQAPRGKPEPAPAITPVTRDASGRWLPGHSPNPTGRPKRDAEIREAFQDLGADAIERVKQLMQSKDEQVAVAACRLALERGYGKPMQSVTVTPLAAAPDREISDPVEAAAVYAEIVSGTLDITTVRIAPSAAPQLEHTPAAVQTSALMPADTAAMPALVPVDPVVIAGRRARPMDEDMPEALRVWNKLGESA
jgi:hypothetical protein